MTDVDFPLRHAGGDVFLVFGRGRDRMAEPRLADHRAERVGIILAEGGRGVHGVRAIGGYNSDGSLLASAASERLATRLAGQSKGPMFTLPNECRGNYDPGRW